MKKVKKKFSKLLKLLKGWKILVIGDNKTNSENWRIFNDSNSLIYLSLNDQLNLNYQTLKYTPLNSYYRKNIGYLYCIEHGAKEIYEIDDNIISNFKYLNYNFNKSNYDRISIGNINKQMINPYSYFGINNIWPKGFRIKDLGKDFNNKFFSLTSNQISLNPIIYQNLINGNPDLDSIFILTRVNKNYRFNINFTEKNPLLYLPGNYVPINSKNTKYMYDIFPFLALPTTINSEISDIIRGYIMQRYAWGLNGTVIFVPSDSYKNQSFINKSDFIKEEKSLYFKLDELINILNHKSNNEIRNPKDFAINIIKKLIYNKILQRKDLKMYKAFLNDLFKFGYSYSSFSQRKIDLNLTKCYKEFTKLKINLISQDKILLLNNKNNNYKLLKHKSSYKKYNDILLAINYNFKNFISINNEFLFSIYSAYFPNIVFISPEVESNKSIISCPNSQIGGYYAYMCFRKVYEKYPNMKGYLIMDDDYFLKPWEFEDYNFNIPWINEIFIRRIFGFYPFKSSYIYLDSQINNNIYYNNNISKSFGYNTIPQLWVELLYFPKSIIIEVCDLVEEMYNQKIFLELAIPTSIGFLFFKEIQIVNSIFIWNIDRKYMENFLKNSLNNVGIHAFKFKNELSKNLLIEYISFINSEEY